MPFCHNALLVTRLAETPEIPEQEVLDFLASRRGLLDGVVLTGGEPLLQPDAADFLRKVRELGFAVKLDTNGCDPARLAEILDRGLVDYVAMDVKNAPARYAETVGVPGFDPAPVEESIRLLRKSTVDYEFRTTLVRELHRPEDLDAIAAWLAGSPRYYLQNFVDSGNLIGRGITALQQRNCGALRSGSGRSSGLWSCGALTRYRKFQRFHRKYIQDIVVFLIDKPPGSGRMVNTGRVGAH